MTLPIYLDPNRNFMLMQTNWSSVINPVLSNPLMNGVFVSASLSTGSNSVNHLLGHYPQGYLIVSQDAAANVYQQTSSMPDLTIVLNSSADVNVRLYVF